MLVITACRPTEKSVTGTYLRHWDFENNSKLTLDNDKTFKLEIQQGLVFFQTTGTWALKNKDLILNSYDNSSRQLNSFVKDKRLTEQSDLYIKVMDDTGSDLPGAPIYVYNSDNVNTFSTNENSEVLIPQEEWDSVRVTFIGFNPLTITKSSENHFLVQLGQSESIGVKLNGERWTIRNNKIIDPKFEEQKVRNVYRKNAR